jgi:hypothetical protein
VTTQASWLSPRNLENIQARGIVTIADLGGDESSYLLDRFAKNEWLEVARADNKKLDDAVFAAYGSSPSISDDELLAKLLELNLD